MDLHRVEFASSGYEACKELRRLVLREPLGLDWSEHDLEEEEAEWHFGLFDGETLVACLVIRPLGAGRVKLRQMAVAGDRQGQGIGRSLVAGVMDALQEEAVREVELHAREEAAGFYARLGFVREGERFEEVGIPHWKMGKRLSSRE